MSLIRRGARPMIAASFIASGLDQLRHPAKQAPKVALLAEQAAPALHLPNDPELLVRANGAAMVGGGTLLALGRMPRMSATVLAASATPSGPRRTPPRESTSARRSSRAWPCSAACCSRPSTPRAAPVSPTGCRW